MNPAQKYKKTAVESASRERLLLMMYEGAEKFIKRAIVACEQKQIAERGMNIGRAFDIISELNNTLDHKVGGEIATNLEQLYFFITEKLTKANISGDVQHLKEALKIVETLHSGWKQAVSELKKAKDQKANGTQAD